MSIWASVCGQEPNFYDDGYGDEPDPRGWMDVAVSVFGDRVRVIVEGRDGSGEIVLDRDGLVELHRRVVAARDLIERGPFVPPPGSRA